VRLHAISCSLLLCVVVGCTDVLVISDCEAASLPDDVPRHRVLPVAPGWYVTFEFEKTTKGNGVLSFPGGLARIHDAHDDGIVFAPFTLRARLADLDGDGFADLEFSGTAVFHAEKGNHELGRRPVRAVFTFIPSQRRFVETLSDRSIYTDAR
jgi:hypothetical protein